MHFLIFVSFISVFHRSIVANSLPDENNLFSEQGIVDSLFPDDASTLWGGASAEEQPNQEELSQLANSNALTLDWASPVQLAGADNNDFCAAAAANEELQPPVLGRMRARRDETPTTCRSSPSSNYQNQNQNQLPNQLELPNLLDIFRKPKTPQIDLQIPPLLEEEEGFPGPPLKDDNKNHCDAPFIYHLCCREPSPNSLVVTDGLQIFNVMLTCMVGKLIKVFFFTVDIHITHLPNK